jgi:hypothetical protein
VIGEIEEVCVQPNAVELDGVPPDAVHIAVVLAILGIGKFAALAAVITVQTRDHDDVARTRLKHLSRLHCLSIRWDEDLFNRCAGTAVRLKLTGRRAAVFVVAVPIGGKIKGCVNGEKAV